MFKTGDKVQVTDQQPAASGEVVEASTWGAVLGTTSDDPCYKVRCAEWRDSWRWISGMFVEAAD